MSQFVGFSWTTPLNFIKSFREESPRSKYINDLVERIESETGSGTTVLLQETLMNYILSNWKRLHEFLELADHVNQLAFRSFRVHLRTFWLHEFTLRRRILEVGWSTDQIQIPGDENPAHILQGFLQRPGDVDIGRFLGLVQPQGFVGTMLDHGIEDRKRLGFMYNRLLRWAMLVPLGIQGTTFCLPSSDERYSMQLLFQIAAVNYQSRLFWRRYDFESPFRHDGWFKKYPVSGSIEHFSLGIDYSRLEKEQDRQRD
ncbi:hypothetical protein RAB80_007072 [Fusarium oxysporum f. sp. vasinfectum]|nr:hypothetical protein RAB80_007072 [Fusarium oxysporum f. sp. vasinfectum]